MIGEKVKIEDFPEDGLSEVKGKKVKWYDHYKWDTMEQYQEWRKWAWEQLKNLGEQPAKYLLNYTDFRYGIIIRYKKEGELF